MILQKKYHFYAGHRNENLIDKCFNLHGHTYYVDLYFDLPYNKETGITMLFSEIDKYVDPVINQLDHSLLIHKKDPLLKYLHLFIKEGETKLKLSVFDEVTSAENLSRFIFKTIKNVLPIIKIKLKETTTSIVEYEDKR